MISAEGKIGKNKASGSIDSEGIWDLGIDFKVGGLGITNDYGGAITISIAGQSITWGREGGKIHYNLGGFEVIVEARDCVVTETKLIMGIEVASHTYPDPGCKLPDPDEELEPPKPPPDPKIGIDPDTITDTRLGYVLVGQYHSSTATTLRIPWFPPGPENPLAYVDFQGFAEVSCSLVGTELIKEPRPFAPWPPGTKLKTSATSGGEKWVNQKLYAVSSTLEFTSVSPSSQSFPGPDGAVYTYFGSGTVTSQHQTPYGDALGGLVRGFVAFGSMATIAQWVKSVMNRETRHNKHIINQVIPLGEQKRPKPRPFLQPGVPPHMKNDCCEEILDSLDDLKEVLHVDFFKKEKFPVPSYLLAPGVDVSKTTVANNYYNLFQKLFQALAHSTIVSPKIDIQDADAVKEGDQPINSEYFRTYASTLYIACISKINTTNRNPSGFRIQSI